MEEMEEGSVGMGMKRAVRAKQGTSAGGPGTAGALSMLTLDSPSSFHSSLPLPSSLQGKNLGLNLTGGLEGGRNRL